MKKTVKLSNLIYGTIDNTEPFILGVNDKLTLKVESDYDPTDLIVIAESTGGQHTQRLSNDEYDVPQKLLVAGKITFTFCLIQNGEVCKRWTVLPLVLKGFGGRSFEMLTYTKAIDLQLKDIERRLAALEKQNEIIL